MILLRKKNILSHAIFGFFLFKNYIFCPFFSTGFLIFPFLLYVRRKKINFYFFIFFLLSSFFFF
ncbi:hypothetical protein U3516DRAFT_888288 [Neocallimastix sp. 'constans']